MVFFHNNIARDLLPFVIRIHSFTTMTHYSRRGFVKIAAAGTGGLLFMSSCTSKPSRWLFFTGEEATLAESIIACLIPADDFPGAKEAGVINFIDRQLVSYHRRFQKIYRTGLAKIQESCVQQWGELFNNLPDEKKIVFLKSLEKGTVPGEIWKDLASSDFFSLILDHTMQGFYGSPRHGGNKDYISYRMLGLDYPFIIGRHKYEKD
jgi:gluconate 2-dehydrogenase gamma chain